MIFSSGLDEFGIFLGSSSVVVVGVVVWKASPVIREVGQSIFLLSKGAELWGPPPFGKWDGRG